MVSYFPLRHDFSKLILKCNSTCTGIVKHGDRKEKIHQHYRKRYWTAIFVNYPRLRRTIKVLSKKIHNSPDLQEDNSRCKFPQELERDWLQHQAALQSKFLLKWDTRIQNDPKFGGTQHYPASVRYLICTSVDRQVQRYNEMLHFISWSGIVRFRDGAREWR